MAMLLICLFSSAAKSSTRDDASYPVTEHSNAGVLLVISLSTQAAKSSSFSAWGIKSSPRTVDTNRWAAAITRSGRKA
uniref:Putative secreted protein n=1 Tax=Anopheles triannulatus TaxID=58253 RepID=A0A2M4B3S6_9DIPT